MRQKYRRFLIGALVLDVCIIIYLCIGGIYKQIPDTMLTYVGKEETLFSGTLLKMEKADDVESVETLQVTGKSKNTIMSRRKGAYAVQVKLFGMIPLKEMNVKVIDKLRVAPSGEPIGIYVETNGLLVLGTTQVEGKDGMVYDPATNIVQSGDYITKMNGKPVKTIKEFNQAIQGNGKKKMVIQIRRNKALTEVLVKPVEVRDSSYKLGIWVREDTQGIGTMTYVSETGKFGALGHGITDADTGTLMNLSGGELFNTEILDIVKGQSGAPGELEGYINMIADNCIGDIHKNTSLGIFGTLSNEYRKRTNLDYRDIVLKQDIKEGNAKLLSRMDGKLQSYDIEIEKINHNSNDNKGMVLQVTDKELLKKTGGIVQGMSGSPLLQDGKVIGAVTHVFVDDPTRGYGIFIENMLAH